MQNILLPFVLIALLASSLIPTFIERRSKKASSIFTTAVLCALFAIAVSAASSGGQSYFLFSAPFLGEASLFADGMSFIFIISSLGISAAVSGFAVLAEGGAVKRGFFTLFALYVAALLGIFGSSNLILLFIFFELMLVASWLMIGFWGGENRSAVSLKYFLYTEFGALLLLAGILLLGSSIGTFDMLAIGTDPAITSGVYLGVALIFAGVLVKCASFPFHSWLPDTYSEAPYALTAVMSFSTMAVGGYVLIRVFQSFVPSILSDNALTISLAIFGLINILYGGVIAIKQDDLKRLLAYSSISQVGYMFIGIASGSSLGFLGVAIWSLAHGLSKSSLFMISGLYRKKLGTDKLSEMGGLSKKMPMTSSVFFASFMNACGIPPFLGFWGELLIFLAFISSSIGAGFDAFKLAIGVIAIASSVITVGYSLWAVRRSLFGELPEGLHNASDPPVVTILPLAILASSLVAIGFLPYLITSLFWVFVP
uniref:NADH-quinone oxidoreductase subunit M n=1 Tax=Candidatus Methanomethylicus mesodigestus TaxID=1867258 RepID=A0A7C3EWH3_9CREN